MWQMWLKAEGTSISTQQSNTRERGSHLPSHLGELSSTCLVFPSRCWCIMTKSRGRKEQGCTWAVRSNGFTPIYSSVLHGVAPWRMAMSLPIDRRRTRSMYGWFGGWASQRWCSRACSRCLDRRYAFNWLSGMTVERFFFVSRNANSRTSDLTLWIRVYRTRVIVFTLQQQKCYHLYPLWWEFMSSL